MLKTLLGRLEVSHGASRFLAELFASNCALREVNLARNQLPDSFALEAARSLAANRRLNRIDLSGNDIGARGAVALLQATADMEMSALDLSNNRVTASPALAPAVKDSMLTELRLARNTLGDAAGAAIISAVASGNRLHVLDVAACSLAAAAATALADLIKNDEIREIYAGMNPFPAEAAEAIANALSSKGSALRILSLKGSVSTPAAVELVRAAATGLEQLII
eukprot:gnl/Ergobibamus_cyprinoides/1856.p1 GENE.gnl/Ergobibamus_cyprinoides/1856~~gnl/Ergobibamus_cyprinoides/1856.p1  ORF type:complete len:224 (+),score=34.54 gnl/Ergobibamus_cyprinoides/1856:708-1379(+)